MKKPKLILVIVLVCGLTNNVISQDTIKKWTFSGFFQQNLNQVNFTNWAAGGENSFSSTSKARFNADYKGDIYTVQNYIDLSYGIIKNQDTPVRKNTDKIDVFSKAGRAISEKTSFTGIFNFVSQFDKGFKYPNDSVVVSRFMAPGYLTIALGFDYTPTDFISIFVSPATGKFTFVLDQELANQGAYGVDPAVLDNEGIIVQEGKRLNPEFGSLVRLEFKKEVVKNVNVNSRITLFNNYTDKDKSNRKNTDVDWLTAINMPINRFITASIEVHLLYDHDINITRFESVNGVQTPVGAGPATQLKQAFGLGLVYSF